MNILIILSNIAVEYEQRFNSAGQFFNNNSKALLAMMGISVEKKIVFHRFANGASWNDQVFLDREEMTGHPHLYIRMVMERFRISILQFPVHGWCTIPLICLTGLLS